MKKLFILFIAVAGFGVSSFGQGTVTRTATAAATIITPITLTKDVDLNFGNVVSSVAGGTVDLSAAASPTRTATGVSLAVANPGTVTAAKFSVGGASGYTYAITLPIGASPVTLTRVGNTETMTAGTFTSTPSGTGTISGVAIDDVIYVGATLNVGANQVAGSYLSTNFNVTVAYN
jgi:hypothetical protein